MVVGNDFVFSPAGDFLFFLLRIFYQQKSFLWLLLLVVIY